LAFQFAMVEPILFIVTDVALATNDFCADSLNPRYANIWVTVIRTISTAMAVLAVWKMYSSTKAIMKPRRAMSKLLSFKIIIGLNVLQTWIFKILVQHNVLKPSNRLSYADLLYGVPAALTSMESVLFALSFHYAFSSGEYASKPKCMSFVRAVVNSANPMDLLKGMLR
ncbi:organic solute transporter subunit alpha/Transmembrane protein, partial [Delphinella strobiligena]